ncbi:hypothetical protein WAB17_06180 [Parerythrobacter aurantius]|uniref:hypothetical protein n=1 Tax=Parerythrobacter aurantius TaxID=3127706 RepID=UPI00324AA83A
MKRSHVIAGVVIVGLTTGLAAALLPPLRTAIGIASPDSASFAASENMFAAEFAGMAPAAALEQSAGLVRTPASGGWSGAVYAEPADDCRGRGIYLFRQPPATALAITAPHRGSDRHTGTIAARLFLETGAAAAGWNSAPRYPTETCPHALDLAREPGHAFTAFATAFARRFPEGRIIQLHGFDRARRDTKAMRDAAVILSDGTMTPGSVLLDLADCLSVTLDPLPVLVFPHEAGELGALRNAQGEALRGMGFDGFAHIEMSLELRGRLAGDSRLRQRFAQCLAGPAA